MSSSSAPPSFCHSRHVSFISALFSRLPGAAASGSASEAAPETLESAATAHLRLSGAYWGLAALSTLRAEGALSADAIASAVAACRHANGGYGGGPGHDAHLLHTLSALQLLALVERPLRGDEARATARWVAALQVRDGGEDGGAAPGLGVASAGGFAGDAWGEVDSRYSYCALQAAALLGSLGELDVPAAVAYIASCANFDGGYGAVPGAESHAGQVFCCVGALAIAGALHRVDADLLGWWLAERQCDGGGLNGRPEKQADVCYSWWILSALAILGRTHWLDGAALARFILRCQDAEGGGIADRPGNVADVYHTFFGVAGLSLLGALDADAAQPHERIDPVYALPRALTERLRLPRQTLEAPRKAAAREGDDAH